MSVAGSLRDLDESLGRLRERRSRLDDAMAWTAASSSERSHRRSLRSSQLQGSRPASLTRASDSAPLTRGQLPSHHIGGTGRRAAAVTRKAGGGRRRRPSLDDSGSDDLSNGGAASLRRALARLAAMPGTVTPVALPSHFDRDVFRHGARAPLSLDTRAHELEGGSPRAAEPSRHTSGGHDRQPWSQTTRPPPPGSRRVRMRLRSSARSSPPSAAGRARSCSPPHPRRGPAPHSFNPPTAESSLALAAARRRRLRQRAYASALAWRTSQQRQVVSQVARMAGRAHDAATVSSRDAARALAAMYAAMEAGQRSGSNRQRQRSGEVRLGPTPLSSWIKPGEALAIATAAAGAALAKQPPTTAPTRPRRSGLRTARRNRATCVACCHQCCCGSHPAERPPCTRRKDRSASLAMRPSRSAKAPVESPKRAPRLAMATCSSQPADSSMASAVQHASDALASAGASVSQLEAAARLADLDRSRLRRVVWALNE